MIASITGQVEHVGLTTAVVAVGGFGVQVQATPETLSGLRIGGEVRLDTAYVARKDESPLLFGFRSPAEREERDREDEWSAAPALGRGRDR